MRQLPCNAAERKCSPLAFELDRDDSAGQELLDNARLHLDTRDKHRWACELEWQHQRKIEPLLVEHEAEALSVLDGESCLAE